MSSSGVNSRRTGFVEKIARVCAAAHEPLALLEKVACLVRPVIGYEAAGWLLVDPQTLLITGAYPEGVTQEMHLALIETELVDDDVNKFFDLAGRDVPVAALSAATNGDLSRSVRWSRLYQPAGFGDEVRAVFRSGGVPWGQVCLTRREHDPFFDADDMALLGAICPHVGNGLRTGLLLGEGTHRAVTEPAPGLVVLTDDGSVESMTAEAKQWMDQIPDDGQQSPFVMFEVAARARASADQGSPGPPPLARVRLTSGGWLMVRASRLRPADGATARTAVLLEPAQQADIAPMLVQLHQLTPREREVTQALLQGRPTREIAETLWITPETLRGHIKAVFAKLGVNSRPELAAKLSRDPDIRLPATTAPNPN